jgi:hypothetical protein
MNYFLLTPDEAMLVTNRPKRGPKLPLPRRPGRDAARRTR